MEYRMTAEHSETGEYKTITCGSIGDAMGKASELRSKGWTVTFDKEAEDKHDSYQPKPERVSHPSPAKRFVAQ